MKRITFYAERNRSGNLLHIETDGCIVNIQVGLHDADGRQVTSVRILPDDLAERGGRWVQDGSRIVQLLDGETELPGIGPDGSTNPDQDSRALNVIQEMLRDPDRGTGMLEDIAELVQATGRTTENYDDERSTWDRH